MQRALILGVLWAMASGATAAEGVGQPQFGGPDAVDNQVQEDAARDWKSDLRERVGLSLGLDYSSNYFKASDSLVKDEAWGGMARFYGSWDVVNRGEPDAGALVWKFEHRHRSGNLAPQGLASQLGYAGLIGPPFSNEGFRFTNLYWRQRLNDGRSTLIAGFLDATDYLDVYALTSPWTGFNNFAFSTGTQTIPVPNDATLGVAFGTMLTDQMFLIAGLTDTNSDPTDLGETVESFFDDHEYFKSVEIGLTQSQGRIYMDNLHLTFWHVDERKRAGTPKGWGLNASYTRFLGSRWMPFIRAGYAEDGGSLLEVAVSAGLGVTMREGRDVLGFAAHWGEPNSDTYGTDLKDQYVAELYYRFKVTDSIALTPDVQLLVDPALNPEKDTLWVVGLRARIAL